MDGIRTGLLRLLLPALLSVGVIGMHTIGHSTDHHSWAALPASQAGHASQAGDVTGTAMADTCDGDCGAHASLTIWPGLGAGSDRMPGGAGLMIVCLAVLFGAGLLALLAQALARRAEPVPRGAPPATPRFPHTGLSLGPAFPLRLVDVAVLRI